MGLIRRRMGTPALLALLLATAAGAGPRANDPAPALPAPCARCPDSLRPSDGTPGVGLSGTLSRVDGHVVLDGCAGRVQFEDLLGESVESLVGHSAWVNALCTGKGRAAAIGGHALGDSVVDVFVMSMCPFGRALERQIATDLASGDSLQRPQVHIHYLLFDRTTDAGQTIFSRHGDQELREDVVQLAVRELEPAKYWPYLRERSTTDTTWTAVASRVGLGWRTLTEVQRRLENELQDRAHAEWMSVALNWPHVDGSPTVFWLGREVKDIAQVPGFRSAKTTGEQCKN